MLVVVVAGAAIVCSIPFVVVLVGDAGLRALAVRGARHRIGQALLVVTGIAVATAIVASAAEVGDSLRASVRRGAVTQLGPVDEEVVTTGIHADALQSALDRAHPRGVAGTLPLMSLEATVLGRDFVERVSPAQVLEVDFARAAQLGGNASATGISGPTPGPGQAVISADLSNAINLYAGHRITIYAFGSSRTFRVSNVLARRGIAGLAAVTGGTSSTSLNIFVAPGTLEAMMRRGTGASGQAQPVSVVAVANVAADRNRAGRATVAAALGAAARGTGADVRPVKQALLDDAAAQSRRFTDLFAAFGVLGALGGLLLLALTFLMVGRDRSRSLGVLRALGLRRRRAAAALALEGWFYAVAGAAIGVGLSLGITAAVVGTARTVFAGRSANVVDLAFATRASSVVGSFAIGILASLATIGVAAWAITRRNIVRTMRGVPEPADPARRRTVAALGATVAGLGIAVTVAGVVTARAVALLAGPLVIAAGAVPLVGAPRMRRRTATVAAAAVLAWSALAVGVVPRAFARLGIGVVVTEGIVMSMAALVLIDATRDALTARVAAGTKRRLAFGLGYAYTRTSRARTALIAATYAIVLFTLTLLVSVSSMYAHDTAAVARSISGSASVEVSSDAADPLPAADVSRQPGVVRVTPAAALGAEVVEPAGVPLAVTVVGFDASFAGHGSPRLSVAPNADLALYQAVAHDPRRVLVGADLHADSTVDLADRTVHVGDAITLRDPRSGRSVHLRVAGLVDNARYRGTEHVYVARAVVNALAGGTAASNLLYVETSPGTNTNVLAAIIDGTHLGNGTVARSFTTLASETLSNQRQFVDLLEGYAAVGLIAVLTGIAALMIDRVRERRRQIAILRALGFRAATIRRSVRIETALIASEGTVAGVLPGLLLAWRLQAHGVLGRPLPLALPVIQLGAIVVAVVVVSLGAATVAARRAGKIPPATSVRAT